MLNRLRPPEPPPTPSCSVGCLMSQLWPNTSCLSWSVNMTSNIFGLFSRPVWPQPRPHRPPIGGREGDDGIPREANEA